MMMMTVTKETEIPRMWIVGAFSVFASVMFYTLMIINIYYLSKERHTNEGCIVYHVCSSVLSVLDGPLHGIIHIVDNDGGFMGGFTSSIHAGTKQDGRPLASKSTLVRVSASDIRFCNIISTNFWLLRYSSTYPGCHRPCRPCAKALSTRQCTSRFCVLSISSPQTRTSRGKVCQ
jgi:hypothetical protein